MPKLPTKRRTGAIDGQGHGVVIEQKMPRMTRDHVMVRVHASLISAGTEMNVARGRRAEPDAKTKPLPFGYQCAGKVIAVGANVKKFAVGDRVACMGGSANHTTYAVVPQNLTFKMPEDVAYEEAAYGHLIITAMHALRRAEAQFGEYLVIAGMGVVGQLTAQLARNAGLWTTGWDMQPFRLRRAKKCGIDSVVQIGKDDPEAVANELTEGHGYDKAVVAFGGDGTAAVEQIKNVMKLTDDGHRWGKIIIVGGCNVTIQGGAVLGNIDIGTSARTGAGYHDEEWELGHKRYPPVFMRWTTQTNFELALRLLATSRLKVKPLTTHRLPLSQIDEAVSAHIDQPNKTIGTLLTMV